MAGAPRSPPEPNPLARSIPDGESNAFVHGIREEIYHAAAPRIEVDLNNVPLCIAEETRLIPLIRGGIVEPRLGEGEHGLHGASLRGERYRSQRETSKAQGPHRCQRVHLPHLSVLHFKRARGISSGIMWHEWAVASLASRSKRWPSRRARNAAWVILFATHSLI